MQTDVGLVTFLGQKYVELRDIRSFCDARNAPRTPIKRKISSDFFKRKQTINSFNRDFCKSQGKKVENVCQFSPIYTT